MTVIAPKQARGPGTVSVTRPADLAVPGTTYKFTALMDAADIDDATLTMTFRLYLDTRIVEDNTWTCGVRDRAGNSVAPNFAYSCPQDPPTTYKVEAVLPRVVNIGLDVSLG